MNDASVVQFGMPSADESGSAEMLSPLEIMMWEADEHDRDVAELERADELRKEKDKQREEDAVRYSVPFPKSAYKGSMHKLARLFGEVSEVPYEFIYVTGLTTFGLIAADKLKLAADGLDTRSNLYTVLLGPTGCKKSTALDMAVKFFAELNYLEKDLNKSGNTALLYPIAGSGEGLIKLFKNGRTRVLLSVDELQSMLQKCRVENSTLGPMLASMFDGGLVGMATKEYQESLNNIHLGLQGAITTQSWEDIWTKGTERELGLLNRLFLVSGVPRKKVFLPPPVDPKALAELKLEVAGQLQKIGSVGISPEGIDVLKHYYDHLDLTEEEATRLDTLAKKLALVLTVTSDRTEMDAEMATAAVEMCEYQLKVRKLLAPSRAQTMTAAVEDKIQRFLEREYGKDPNKSFYLSQIADKTGMRKTVGTEVVKRVLTGMAAAGTIHEEGSSRSTLFRYKKTG